MEVILSINPEWCAAIAAGRKTVEVRLTRPRLFTPFKCYIYCTSAGKLTGKKHTEAYELSDGLIDKWSQRIFAGFTCTEIFPIPYTMDGTARFDDCVHAAMWPDDFAAYGKGKPLYGWEISGLEIYDEPRKLSDFGLKQPPQSWCYWRGL